MRHWKKGVQVSLFENIKEVFRMFFKSRLAVAAVLMTVLFGVLLWRVFYLQIIKGEEYQDNYTLKIVKEQDLEQYARQYLRPQRRTARIQ